MANVFARPVLAYGLDDREVMSVRPEIIVEAESALPREIFFRRENEGRVGVEIVSPILLPDIAQDADFHRHFPQLGLFCIQDHHGRPGVRQMGAIRLMRRLRLHRSQAEPVRAHRHDTFARMGAAGPGEARQARGQSDDEENGLVHVALPLMPANIPF